MKQKTCDEVGVCQALRDCKQCRASYPFAPGVLERPQRRRRLSAVRWEFFWIRVMFLVSALIFVTSLLALLRIGGML